jgi:choline monooxygenase
MLNVYPDNYSTNLIIPLGPERTVTIFEWYFRCPESSEAQEKLKETVEFSDEIQIEDIKICESVQRGLRSSTYRSGRYSVKRENGVHHFHGLLSDFMNS